MQIRNCGRGIHRNEIAGVDKLRSLPASWYAFTNLDLSLGAGVAREIDVILVTDRRVLVIDLKNWGTGTITAADGRWFLDGSDMGASPVPKILDIKRQLYILLKRELESRPETRKLPVPKIDGLVVLTDNNDRTSIPAIEKSAVMTVTELTKIVTHVHDDINAFGGIAREIISTPLTEPFWKERLTRFFNGGNKSPLEPGRRKFDRYIPEEVSVFEHPDNIYREFEAREEGAPPNLGTLRLWDFTKVKDTRFQTAEARAEIVGRERRVYHWLRDRSEYLEKYLLLPRVDDTSGGVDYWEIYDRRRRLKRLSDWSNTEIGATTAASRIELARQLLSGISEIHKVDAAHLDLGGHSVWLETPTTVKFSHLFAARHPNVDSLGESRYNFLASVHLPEDVLALKAEPPRRDVYLAGVAVHQILFGQIPSGNPPEWHSSVDASGEFQQLYDWFAEALDVDPRNRFANARNALEMFNRATTEHPTPHEVKIGLEKYRTDVKSQMALVSRYPIVGEQLRESDRVDVWQSSIDDESVVVKMWKQAAWGNIEKEAKRILSFLEAAANVKMDAPEGIPRIRSIHWLADAFALVQEWTPGRLMSELLSSPPEAWCTPAGALQTVIALEQSLSRLHEASIGHGDIKPDNIVLSDDGTWTFLDFFDFSPIADGEIQNSGYSAGGDRFQRDRFALLKLAEEILAYGNIPTEEAVSIAKAIEECRTKAPTLTTLTPFAEAIAKVYQDVISPPAPSDTQAKVLSISIKNAETGLVEPDEGRYYTRTEGHTRTGPAKIFIRGAFEEIEVKLDDTGTPRACIRRKLSQTRIAIVSRHETYSFEGSLTVREATQNDFRQLAAFLSALSQDKLLAPDRQDEIANTDEEPAPIAKEEEVEERLAERVAEEGDDRRQQTDVPMLWRELITIEKELTTDARALVDSSFDKNIRRHKVAIELESGNFDFDRNDTVGVLRQTKGAWRRIGELDVSRSTPGLAVFDPPQFAGPPHSSIVEDGQRLRFISHFETESLKRRSGAVDRILSGQGRAGNLVSVFDPRTMAKPQYIPHAIDEKQLEAYGLNSDQTAAFRSIVTTRPVGLLQGPPGTGKTRFIAALAHYAITQNLARNVLLSSQGHEAVNTAAEALLKLFRKSGGDPSILRVAMNEDQVSDSIREFHTPRVEQSLKDRFSASFDERIAIAGRAIGVDLKTVKTIVAYQQHILPLAQKLEKILESSDNDDPRVTGLRNSLERLLDEYGLPTELAEIPGSPYTDFAEEAEYAVMDKHTGTGISSDKISKLMSIAAIGRDFVSSASRFQRSFEPFLAGTRQIVAGTCVGLGRTSLGLTTTSFDLVIVDEAARCTASELLVPLQAARWAVLVGDQAQLQPQHKAEIVDRVASRTKIPISEIKRSDFERVFDAEYGNYAGCRLTTQYRMLEPIGRVVSETFYSNFQLKPGRTDPILPQNVLPEAFRLPLTWIDTSTAGETAFESKVGDFGRSNRFEADTIVSTLESWLDHETFMDWLCSQTDYPVGVGIICMYAGQRDLIRKRILRSALAEHLDRHIKVGTVDSYQGKENPIVILSLVRNNKERDEKAPVSFIREGFLITPNRINVAASRAMDKLIVVGSGNRWRQHSPMWRFREKFREAESEGTATLVGASELLRATSRLGLVTVREGAANG